jgi:hypothetical protein
MFIAKPRTTTIGLEQQHGTLNGSAARFCPARTDFKSWGAQKGPNGGPRTHFRPRNGSDTVEERL